MGMVTAPRGQQQQSQGLTKALSLQRARPQARSPLRRHATSTERRRKRLGPGHVVAAAATTPIRGASEPPRGAPEIGASGLPNRFWEWRGQRIRYQVAGEDNVCGPSLVLVHGLFVNADHWRNNISALAGEYGMRVYAMDLLGSGYSSKPSPTSAEARAISGENGRDLTPSVSRLGTAWGGSREGVEVVLQHPLGSVYNFYTWAEQVADFTKEVVRDDKVTLVCNSIGTMTALQAALDCPDIFRGVLVVNPNFRELHAAEVPSFALPAIRAVQRLLRERGHGLFNALAKPDTVKQILKEPYYDPTDVTDSLVDALLTPLLTEGSADVVFDNLSYSAGPLPEQQLADPGLRARVWVCYGTEDPWTPSRRVEALTSLPRVERVVPFPKVGHCPHDEAPELVNPLVAEFVASFDDAEGEEVAATEELAGEQRL